MEALNPGWYNRNAQRKYPLTDAAVVPDLPESFLLDASLYVPESLGVTAVILGSAARTRDLLSLVLVGVVPGGAVALAAASAVVLSHTQPVAVEALCAGVRGFVVLGNRSVPEFRVSYTGLEAELLPAAWETYKAPPVSAVFAEGRSTPLTGDVRVQTTGHLQAVLADQPWVGAADYDANPRLQRTVDGKPVPAVVLRLNPDLSSRELMSYLGKCVTATKEACYPAVIQTINDVFPDENGNIDIEIVGIPLKDLIDTEGLVEGVVLESPLGITSVCGPGDELSVPPPILPDCET